MPNLSELPYGAKLLAGVELISHTGAATFQLRYSDDEEPVVWTAVASYVSKGPPRWECAGALDPETAVLRLCEELIDGGQCTHCKRSTGFSAKGDQDGFWPEVICWYLWNPKTEKFERSCRVEHGMGKNVRKAAKGRG